MSTQEKLDKLIDGHAYEVYITKDLPDAKCDKEQLRLRKIYRAEFRKLIDSAKREGKKEAVELIVDMFNKAGMISGSDANMVLDRMRELIEQSEESI